MAVIHVLDQHTAELIAAGEVVERPASAAKELLENAIDAGATQITLSITRGGIAQIQVSDNGSGIEAEYISKAFIRHATSKIQTESDLEHIHTLGFRGEALASISSVARVEVLTRTEQDEFACSYRIEGGKELGMEPGARPVGTTITVNDLFYNTPARMKFLKKDVSEGTFVADVILHAALSHPEISFRFIREGKQQFVTPGDGKLQSAAYAVLGREFSRDLIAVDTATGAYRVTGLITPPRACRASRGAQYFYINNRYVKNRTMMAAMENAYKGTLMQGKFPGGILSIEMPAELVDVNVHPAKTEVRFAREGDVFDAVYAAVKQALTTPGTGECRFDLGDRAPVEPTKTGLSANLPRTAPVNAAANKPAGQSGFTTVSAAEYREKYMGEKPAPKLNSRPTITEVYSPLAPAGMRSPMVKPVVAEGIPDAPKVVVPVPAMEPDITIYPDLPAENSANDGAATEKLNGFTDKNDDITEISAPELPIQKEGTPVPAQLEQVIPEQTTLLPEPEIEPLQYVGEVFKTYIITQRGNEMCLIDKHAAHERLLFEQLAADYGNVPSQMLLVPVQVDLSAEEKQGLMQNESLLRDAGMEVEDFGGNTVLVRSVPADVAVDNVEDLTVELAAKLAQGSKDALSEKTEWVLHSISCRAAIKAGDKTGPEQLLRLAEEILAGKVPPFCPHGRPVVLKLTRRELEKQFGRIV